MAACGEEWMYLWFVSGDLKDRRAQSDDYILRASRASATRVPSARDQPRNETARTHCRLKKRNNERASGSRTGSSDSELARRVEGRFW